MYLDPGVYRGPPEVYRGPPEVYHGPCMKITCLNQTIYPTMLGRAHLSADCSGDHCPICPSDQSVVLMQRRCSSNGRSPAVLQMVLRGCVVVTVYARMCRFFPNKLWLRNKYLYTYRSLHFLLQRVNIYCRKCEVYGAFSGKIQIKLFRRLECGPMPNVMVALPNVGSALCSTPPSLAEGHYYMTCSNAAKTRNPLKFAAVPPTTGSISAASGPKFAIL